MARYFYTATSINGQPTTGEIEAANLDAAHLQLSARGLRSIDVAVVADATAISTEAADPVLPALQEEELLTLELVDEPTLWASRPRRTTQPSEPPLLPAEEAQQLAEQLAILARGGLPLGPGLRAAAAETPSRRLANALTWLGEQLDAGRPLDQVLAEKPRLMPEHVRRIVTAGVRSGRLPEALDELVEIDRSSRDLARALRLALAYPLLLLVLFATLFVLIEVMVVPDMLKVYEDFEIELPWRVRALFWLSGERMMIAVGIVVTAVPMLLLVVRAAMPPSARRGVIAWIPLYGPAVFWRAVAGWSRLLALLLDYGVPAPDALRMASDGSYDANVRAAGRRVAQAVSAGRPMADAVWSVRRLPAALVPLIGWGEAAGALPDALRSAAQMFEDRARLRASLLRSVLPPIVFVFVAMGGLVLLATLLLPLVNVIQSLM